MSIHLLDPSGRLTGTRSNSSQEQKQTFDYTGEQRLGCIGKFFGANKEKAGNITCSYFI